MEPAVYEAKKLLIAFASQGCGGAAEPMALRPSGSAARFFGASCSAFCLALCCFACPRCPESAATTSFLLAIIKKFKKKTHTPSHRQVFSPRSALGFLSACDRLILRPPRSCLAPLSFLPTLLLGASFLFSLSPLLPPGKKCRLWSVCLHRGATLSPLVVVVVVVVVLDGPQRQRTLQTIYHHLFFISFSLLQSDVLHFSFSICFKTCLSHSDVANK